VAESVRQQRVAHAILKSLSLIMLREYGGTALGGVCVQEVRVTPDLRNADAWYTLLPGSPRRLTQDKLSEESKHIRYLLAKEIRHIKFMPELHFRFDEKAEDAVRLQELLDTLSRDRVTGDGGEEGGDDGAV
jgi:ribosome-binding factor A